MIIVDQKLREAFESLNLSEKEIKVYLSLLQLGEAPINSITKLSEINRVTVYPLIKRLMEKGFVSKLFIEGKSYFKSIPPRQILDVLEEKKERIQGILPQLESQIGSIKTSTSIELFKGKKGMFSLIEKLFNGEDKQMYSYGNFEIQKKVLEYQAMHGRKLRIMRKIKMDIIISDLSEDYLEDKEYKKVTKINHNPALKEINVYIVFGKRKVAIFEVKEEVIGILIENEEIAKYHKFIYDSLLKSPKKITKLN